jgi:hypothetical protein
MTLAIKIGAGSQVYDNVALANSMRGYQKLSITGTGEEIKAALGDIDLVAANVSSIKATNDLNLTTTQVSQYKAALVKLGTKSIVLDSSTTSINISDKFNQLDAVYTKIKSITISPEATPVIAVEKLATAVNLTGLEVLTGKTFDVSGTAVTIKANMDSLLKNISKIGKINIAAGSEVEFTAKQLSILGDKLVKGDSTSKVVLTDTADNLLTTGSLSLINRLNNTNVKAAPLVATASSATSSVISADNSFVTGDLVTVDAAAGALDGNSYYARRLSDTTFALYTSYAQAINTTSTNGRVDTSSLANADTVKSKFGNVPLRTTTLDTVNVKNATLAQADRFVTLTTLDATVTTPGAINRPLSDVVKSVEIADTISNLNAGEVTKTSSTLAVSAANTDAGTFTIAGHGYNTGDAVTYSVAAGATKIVELTVGNTYFVGKIGGSASTFALFNSRSAALAADLTDVTTAKTDGAIDFDSTYNASATTAGQKFTTSNLDKTMDAVGRLNANSGNVGRVTIKGDSNRITAATFDEVATKALRGNSSAQVAYSGKAVDITNNLQALYDNNTVTTAKHLTEIVVTDGTAIGKKGFSMSQTFYSALAPLFKNGADNPTLLVKAAGTLHKGAASNTTGHITIAGHGYSTGDAVTYSVANSGTALTGLTDGNTYYVGKLDDSNFVLFNTKAKALAADLSSQNAAYNAGNGYLATTGGGNAADQKFTTGIQVKNYSFNITGATFDAANPTALQNDSNISSYSVVNASYDNLVIGNQLRIALGQSKLKSITTESISDATQRSTIRSLLNAIGSPVDRAKLKLMA